MKRFSQLLVTLILKTARNDKISVMSEYFKYTPDPDRGYALGALTGTLSIPEIKPSLSVSYTHLTLPTICSV